jgi:Mg2+ and Co2+ transporter CorA
MQHHAKMTVRQTVVERAAEANNSQHPAVAYESRATIPQSAALLPFELETFLDEKNARNNAMYALSNIFRHAAFSEAQVLNVLDRQIEHELGVMQPEDMRSHTLDNLQYFSSILTRHIRHIRNALRALKSTDNEFSAGGDAAITSATRESLMVDFDELLSRALDLYERCKDGMGVMQNRAIIVESRKAIEQSERVKKLTMLASFFVPLSFSTSVFGMNFQEFGQGHLSVWLFAVVSIPIIVLSFCFYMWDMWAWTCVGFWMIRRFIISILEWRFRRQKRSLT